MLGLTGGGHEEDGKNESETCMTLARVDLLPDPLSVSHSRLSPSAGRRFVLALLVVWRRRVRPPSVGLLDRPLLLRRHPVTLFLPRFT